MSFWNLSGGESAVDAVKGGEYDAGGGNFGVIPDGTTVLAVADDAKWQSNFNKDAEYVNIRWEILGPEEYAGRKLFQKIWAGDHDPQAKDPEKKKDKAISMLAAIDANAGGKLVKLSGKPDDEDLALALLGKPMTLRLGVWEQEIQGSMKEGNWVQYVAPKANFKGVTAPAKPAQKAAPKAKPVADDLDDDVPF